MFFWALAYLVLIGWEWFLGYNSFQSRNMRTSWFLFLHRNLILFFLKSLHTYSIHPFTHIISKKMMALFFVRVAFNWSGNQWTFSICIFMSLFHLSTFQFGVIFGYCHYFFFSNGIFRNANYLHISFLFSFFQFSHGFYLLLFLCSRGRASHVTIMIFYFINYAYLLPLLCSLILWLYF